MLWLIPLLLVMIIAGCDDRVGIVSPPIVTTPAVSSTNPADLAPNVAFNSKLTATFSEAMDSLTITTATFTLMQGTSFVSGTVSYTNKIAMFSPSSDLAPNTTYTATITTGAKNRAGTALAKNYVWSFVTSAVAVNTLPTVTSTDPDTDATGVALDKQIAATFSKAMDPTTVTSSTYILQQGTTSISGFVSYSGTTALFTPASNLTASTKYTATITIGAKDLTSNALANNYVWSFTTTSGASYNVALSSLPTAGGTTSGAGTFNSGSSVTVTATPNTGYNFINWTDGGIAVSTSANYTFTISSNRTLVANFALPAAQYTVALSSNPSAGGTTSGGGTFNTGTSVTVTATPNTGYTFTNWTENGIAVSTNANYQFSIIQNRTLVANFTTATGQNTVLLSSNPLNGGTTSGGGSFNTGTLVTVTATPNSGYTFTNWTENSVEVSTNANYTFTITGNRTLVANFTTSGPSGPGLVNLGSAGDFVVIAGSGVSNIGLSILYGDVGAFPTATINGFPPGVVVGTLYMTADPIVGTAKDDLTTAYNDAQGRSLNAISLPGQLGGLTLAPGLYVNSTSSGISGTGPNGILTLDAGGNPNATWIFKMGSTLVTDAGTSIVLAGGAKWENIFWSVGSSATLGTNSIFYGNLLADQSITLTTGATLRGRALTRIGAVTLETNIVDKR